MLYHRLLLLRRINFEVQLITFVYVRSSERDLLFEASHFLIFQVHIYSRHLLMNPRRAVHALLSFKKVEVDEIFFARKELIFVRFRIMQCYLKS